MFKLFKRDPSAKLEQKIKTIMTKALQAQRNGDLKLYAKLVSEAEELTSKVESMRKAEEG